jgi:hypothetical protein
MCCFPFPSMCPCTYGCKNISRLYAFFIATITTAVFGFFFNSCFYVLFDAIFYLFGGGVAPTRMQYDYLQHCGNNCTEYTPDTVDRIVRWYRCYQSVDTKNYLLYGILSSAIITVLYITCILVVNRKKNKNR